MNRLRLRVAERLKESQNAAAPLTTFNEIDLSALVGMYNASQHDTVGLGFIGAFAKACVLALKEIPAANASIEGEDVVYRDYVDLGVAVATPRGLASSVVRNADSLSFVGIEKAIAELGKKVSSRFLSAQDTNAQLCLRIGSGRRTCARGYGRRHIRHVRGDPIRRSISDD